MTYGMGPTANDLVRDAIGGEGHGSTAAEPSRVNGVDRCRRTGRRDGGNDRGEEIFQICFKRGSIRGIQF
jgi:hypothetical protein